MREPAGGATRYGVVWPMPGAEPSYPSPLWAETFRAAGFTHVRMDVPVSRDRDNARASVQVMRDAGLHVNPILAWPYAEPDIDGMRGYAEWYIRTFPDSEWVTLNNEPWILDKIEAHEYLRVAEPMAEALLAASPTVKVVFAMDLFDHIDGEDRGWPGVEHVIDAVSMSDRYYADIHPYRNPYRATWSRWGSRDHEYAAIAGRLGHRRFIYGEIGWKPSEGPKQASGQYLVDELEIDTGHSLPLVCIYTHIASLDNPAFDFGLWLVNPDHTLTPRPCATRVSEYLLTEGTGF